MKREALNIRCTTEWKEAVKAAADKRGVTVSAYVKDAIFEKMKKDAK